MTKNELNFEIKHSKELLENLTGEKILGFRTPQFRKNRFTEELLINNGYKYDSSSVNTNFLNRYKKNQFHNTDIKNFSVSSILGKLPAGVKWINLFGNFTNKKDDVTIIYLHLFDLLTMKEILDLYDKKIVSKTVLSFYLARVNSVISTVNKVTKESHPLKDFLF